MTPHELRGLIAGMGLSQAAVAQLIGVSPRALRNWIAGDVAVPGPAVRLLRLVADGCVTQAEIEYAAGEKP